jgi:hypothetical protein
MNATEHREQIQQQITRAWQKYLTACLYHETASADLAMKHINDLLDRMPRQRTPGSA